MKYPEKYPEPVGRPFECRLSVLVVNYNSGDQLRGCLESVYSTVKTAPFEVIVVDNRSTDSSAEIAAECFPEARFIMNRRNRWFTGGMNQAMEASRGEYMLCLNPDTVCHEDAIDELVEFLDSHPQAGLAGPKLLNADGSLQPSCRNWLKSRKLIVRHLLPWRILPNSWRKRAVHEYWDHDETVLARWLIGACLLARRQAVEDAGLKDEGFPMFHEETDWCYRMMQRGWETWFVHTARVTHFGSQSAVQYWGDDLVLEFYRGKHRFVRKHFGALPLLVHRVLLAGLLSLRLLAALAALPFSGREKAGRRTRFLLKGLAIQLGIEGGGAYSGSGRSDEGTQT